MPGPLDRKGQQAKGTRDALKRAGKKARIHPHDDPDQMEYMYQNSVLVCRVGDLEKVQKAIRDLKLGPWKTRRNKPLDGVVTFDIPDDLDPDALCDQIDEAAGVDGIVMPDHIVHITNAGCCPATEPHPAPDDPTPPVAADKDLGDQAKVWVIDTGRREDVEGDHDWLKRGITGESEDDPTGSDVGRYTGHGTFVCGVLRAMAPKSDIRVRALMIYEGAVVESDLAVDLKKAVDAKPDVICMSAGTTSRKGYAPIVLERVCEILRDNGHTLLVAAAGNDGDDRKFYPAAFSDSRTMKGCVVSVGATDAGGERASYSNREWPRVYARGSDVVNAYPKITYTYAEGPEAGQHEDFDNGMAMWSGTSFATPLVAGLVAARLSKPGPRVSPREAWERVFAGAVQKPFGWVL